MLLPRHVVRNPLLTATKRRLRWRAENAGGYVSISWFAEWADIDSPMYHFAYPGEDVATDTSVVESSVMISYEALPVLGPW